MKKTTKLIVLLAVIAVLTGLVSLALADDRIYTSPSYKIPKDRIRIPVQEEVAEPDETEEPAEPEGTEVPAEVPEEADPSEAEPAEQPAETVPAEQPAEPAEQPAETVPAEQPTEPAAPAQPAEPVREVRIYSSRREVVTEGDIIELTSELIGFDGVEVTYQWQVDRNDGEGRQDVEGANRWKYMFIANRETILYNWRLIVKVSE